MSRGRIVILPDVAAVAEAAAHQFVTAAQKAIAARGRFLVALSGGSTPRALHTRLAQSYREQVEWPAVHVFWGDERCVPPDHPDSNYRMAQETLLADVPIPSGQVYRLRGEADPPTAALEYEQTLRRVLGADPLDLVFLGMGADMHTASLFPGTAAIHEQTLWVVAHHVPKLQSYRLTLTPAVLNLARQAAFLVVGADKAGPLAAVHTDDYRPDERPAQVIQPVNGELLWLVDRVAAGGLEIGDQRL
ncbi:MAG: 6-phosphogluconolactonase [Chloroflexota bacterium]